MGPATFEQRLEQVISGAFARAFRSAVQPVEIAAALQREVDNNAQILSRHRRLVPNDFHVELSATDLDRLAPYDAALAERPDRPAADHADAAELRLHRPDLDRLRAADDLTTGRFRIRSQAQAERHRNDHAPTPSSAHADPRGQRHRHPLQPPGLVVGRGAEADLRINDPGVSRAHPEFRVTAPTASTRSVDLGSTNGILVDGTKVDARHARTTGP